MVVSKIQKFAQLNKNNEKRDYKQSNAVDILKKMAKEYIQSLWEMTVIQF